MPCPRSLAQWRCCFGLLAAALLGLAGWVLPCAEAHAGGMASGSGSVRSTSSGTKRFDFDRTLGSSAKKTTSKRTKSLQSKDWEDRQMGGHCLYGTDGALLHAPEGRSCQATEAAPGSALAPVEPGTGPSDREASGSGASRRGASESGASRPGASESAARNRAAPVRSEGDACVAGDCRDGFGTYSWSDGSRYSGLFRGGRPHGQGTLIDSNGGSYVGQWQRGTRTGHGTAAYANGQTQTGQWDRGRYLGPAPAGPPAARAPARRPVRWPTLRRPARRVGGGEEDVAVIVGIERYAHVPAIPRAAENAAAWFQYFVRTRDVPVANVTLLLDEDATREDIEFAAQQAAERAGSGGTLWFVFIGHGAPSARDDDGLLVGFDVQQRARSLEARSLPQGRLVALLERTRARRVQILLDACFSGRSGSGEPLLAGLQPLVVTSTAATTDPRTTLFTAARGDEFAGPLPGAARPAFSYLALGGLRGWVDLDEDGSVAAGELHRYVSGAIQAVVHDRRQRPTLVGRDDQRLARSARERGPDLADLVLESARRAP